MLLPLHVGGGPDEPTKAYNVLRSAEGKGGSAKNENGIDGLWRRTRALGLSVATSPLRRAFNNAFPNLAQDTLPYYERVLGLVNSGYEEQRRREIVPLWTAKSSCAIPSIAELLEWIDPRFTVDIANNETASTSLYGRWLGTEDDPVWDGASALACETSTELILAVLNVADQSRLSDEDHRVLRIATVAMRKTMASWTDFAVVVGVGFVLGESPLGLVALGEDEDG